MATFASIKAKIVSKVQAQTTYFATGSVYQYEPKPAEVTQDPFAVVVASGNENDFASSSDNKRTFAFTVRIFVARTGTAAATEATLMAIVDALINAFDQDYTLAGEVISILAVPSKWAYVQIDKEYRTADVVIKARVWFDAATTPPTITNSLSASGTVGTPFSFQLTASGDSPITFGATPLPGGLSLSGSVISGTPTGAGTTNVSETAENSGGSDSETLVITIGASAGGGGGGAP